MNVYHKYNVTLPLKPTEYWIVHDELETTLIQAQLNVLKFVAHDLELDRIGLLAGGTAASLAAVIAVLGLTSVISAFLGGGGGGGSSNTIDVFAINMQLNNNTNNINSLSSSSMLAINTLNNTTNCILGYINNLTRYSTLNSNGLNVSGVSILYGNTTLLSSLNVSGFTTLNNNVSLISSFNVSGKTTFNNVATLLSSLNVSGNTNINNNLIINATTSYPYLGVGSNYNSSFISMVENRDMYILNTGVFDWNNMTSTTSIKIDDGTGIFIQTLNIITSNSVINLQSNIINLNSIRVNVSSLTTLSNDTTLVSSLNVSGFIWEFAPQRYP